MTVFVEFAASVTVSKDIGVVILKRFLGHRRFPLQVLIQLRLTGLDTAESIAYSTSADYGVTVEDVGVAGVGVLVGVNVRVAVGVRVEVGVLVTVAVRDGVRVGDGV